jgi:drug/metabolite transporter (DMT)-like permease
VAHFLATRDWHEILGQAAPVYWLALLMAAVSTVMPIVLTSEGIRRIGASHASIVGSVGPVATIFLGFFFLGEPITAVQVAGAALVLAGVVTVSLHTRKSND